MSRNEKQYEPMKTYEKQYMFIHALNVVYTHSHKSPLPSPALSFSSALMKLKALVAQSCPTLCNPLDCSPQAPLSVEFSRQKYESGLPFPPPGDLPDSGFKARSTAL